MNTPTGLQCESAVSPCDVDCPTPRFSWYLPVGVQSAWQMEVYTAFDHDDPASLLWQSEWVADPETLDRRYMGPPLAA